MRKILSIGFATTLFACAEASAPPPEYNAPLNGAAYKAYKAAMKTDWLDKPYDIGDAPDSVNAMNYQQSVDWNEKKLANDKAPKVYKALQKLQVENCAWGSVKKRKLPERVQERVTVLPAGAYLCQFTVHYRINPPYGDAYELNSEGYFFQEGRTYVYAGKFAHPY